MLCFSLEVPKLKINLGAKTVSRAEFSHGNLFMTVTDNFNQLYDFLTTKLS